MEDLEKRVAALELRNTRVDADKKWETSLERRAAILAMTYIIMVIVLSIIGTPKPWINALVPSIGFLLSTLTLRLFKQKWVERYLDSSEK
jgi:hypothetical protein